MKNFIRILRIAAQYKGYALLNIVFNIISVFFAIFSLSSIAPLLDVLFKSESEFERILKLPPSELSFSTFQEWMVYQLAVQISEIGKQETLLWVCGFVLGATILKNLSKYFAMFFLAVIRNNVVRDLRNSIYKKILHLPLAYFSEERKGDVMAKASNDVQEVEWSIMTSLETTFREPITIIGMLVALFISSPQLTLFIFIMLPISGLIIGRIGKSLKKTSTKGQNQMGELLSMIEETLTGLRIIKAFNAEEKSYGKFSQFNQTYSNLMISLYRKRDLASPLSETLGIAVVSVVLMYGGSLVFSGELEASFFTTYLILFSQIINPVKALSSASYHVQKGSASLDRINEILHAEESIKSVESPIQKQSFEDLIHYQHVDFSYNEEKKVLDNIDLEIKKGQTIALVGPSGGGKSTLADLLPRYFDVNEGVIKIDGVNIKQLDLQDLRELMGVVTQQSILFNDTVANNISFGSEGANKEAIIQAAKIANAHEFIELLENGYDTNIGDGGNKLSGGQRQRLSIARAVLKNPPIMILDEATSALDTESEKLVQSALENLMKNRTSIVIAHRLSTIQNADLICVIENGVIIERGSHTSLLEQNGTYRKLFDLQSFK